MVGWILSGLTAMGALGARVWSRAGSRVAFSRARRRKAAHSSAGLEPLLCFGALMAACDAPIRRGEGRAVMAAELADCWGISDACSARSTLQDMLVEAQCLRLDEDFRRLQRGESSLFDGEQRLRWNQAKRAWLKAGMTLPEGLSMAAHDLECIAWLARRCLECGYLSESQTWLSLAWVAEAAIRLFGDWQPYAASFVLGRATLLRDNRHTTLAIRAVKALRGHAVEGTAGLWRTHPLARIQVSEAVMLAEPLGESGAITSQQALLAFGALIATSGGARADAPALAPGEADLHRLWLAEHWRAIDSASVRARLDWLLETGSRAKFDALLRRNNEAACESVAAQAPRHRQARHALLCVGLDPEQVDGCRTLLAYDLERAAFGARLAFTVGLLDEATLWNYLRHMARRVRKSFASWEEYLVSVVLGQALANEERGAGKQLIQAGMALLDGISPFAEHLSPWQACPLDRLPVLYAVASPGQTARRMHPV